MSQSPVLDDVVENVSDVPASGPAQKRQQVVRHRANSPLARAALLAFVVSPLAVLVILCVLIWMSLEAGPAMNEPPRGAGAGQTGMHNMYMGVGRAREDGTGEGP